MKDKLQAGNDLLKDLVKTGGGFSGKMLDKSADVMTDMMGHTSGLISKLSDDIGTMADRILATEKQIGQMADRIVRTEELMARLTAALADKDLELTTAPPNAVTASWTVLLDAVVDGASVDTGPQLRISGNPSDFLLFLSTDPLFREGRTVVSRISRSDDYGKAWTRSVESLCAAVENGSENDALSLFIAVRAIDDDGCISAMSNSIEI